MLGFIKKDLFLIKGNMKAVGIMLVVLIGMALFQDINLAFLPSFISVVLFLSTFSYDEYNKWDSYAITLPNGRKHVVGAKYVTTIILLLISVAIATILAVVIGKVRNQLNLEEIVGTMGGSIFAVILLISITYPIIFKFGNEKGRIAMFVITFLGVSLFTILLKSINIPKDMISFLEQYSMILIIIVSILILIGSYILSKHIYEKKEF